MRPLLVCVLPFLWQPLASEDSHIRLPWLFNSPATEWVCLSSPGTHTGDDAYAQDWLRQIPPATLGQPVLAGLTGTVAARYRHATYGLTVVIFDAARDLALRYAHLHTITVAPGERVYAGRTVVGTLGDSALQFWQPATFTPGTLSRRAIRRVTTHYKRIARLRPRLGLRCAISPG
jgi:hypothetical protein